MFKKHRPSEDRPQLPIFLMSTFRGATWANLCAGRQMKGEKNVRPFPVATGRRGTQKSRAAESNHSAVSFSLKELTLAHASASHASTSHASTSHASTSHASASHASASNRVAATFNVFLQFKVTNFEVFLFG